MPCYVFTYHARGSWLPDHKRGYVKRGLGIQPPDPNLANAYRANMRDAPLAFTPDIQRILIETARNAGTHISAAIHAVATESTHLHVHVSWKHARSWKSMRASLRSALSRALNAAFGRQDWFADSPSRKRVRDYEHFNYLVLVYHVNHRGEVWRNPADVDAAERRDARRAVSVRQRSKRKTSDA